MSQATSESFTFTSGGDRLVGTLYLPAGQPVAAVVTTGPLTSVKGNNGAYLREHSPNEASSRWPSTIERSTRARGNAPTRRPRGRKAADVRRRDGVWPPTSGPAIFPVVAVGVCAGAGYMARAVADDQRLRAFAGVAGYYSDAAEFANSSPEHYQAAIDRGLAAEQRWQTRARRSHPRGRRRTVAMWRCPCGRRATSTALSAERSNNYTNGFAVQSLAHTTPFDAQGSRQAGSRCRSGSCIPSTHSLPRSRASSTARSVRRRPSGGWNHRARSTSTTTPPHRPAADLIVEVHFTAALNDFPNVRRTGQRLRRRRPDRARSAHGRSGSCPCGRCGR